MGVTVIIVTQMQTKLNRNKIAWMDTFQFGFERNRSRVIVKVFKNA